MNVSKKSIGLSAGVKGARISANTSGRVTRTVGIPGSGISHSSSTTVGGRSSWRPSQAANAALPARATPKSTKPGLFAPAWEKKLFKQVKEATDGAVLQDIGRTFPEAAQTVAMVDLLSVALPGKEHERSRSLLSWLHSGGYDPTTDKFFTKYVEPAGMTIAIATGVSVTVPLDRQTLSLLLAEFEQRAGNVTHAIEIVEQLNPTTIVAVSLAKLYAEAERWEDVVSLTDGITNNDEPSTYLLIQRGISLRQQGYHEASRTAFKEALRIRSRSQELRHLALVSRGRTYVAEGKKALARKDYERVLAENSQYPGLKDLLDQTAK